MNTSDVEEIRDLHEENFEGEANGMEHQFYFHNKSIINQTPTK